MTPMVQVLLEPGRGHHLHRPGLVTLHHAPAHYAQPHPGCGDRRLPFHLRPQLCAQAVERGIHFEITYSAALRGAADAAGV